MIRPSLKSPCLMTFSRSYIGYSQACTVPSLKCTKESNKSGRKGMNLRESMVTGSKTWRTASKSTSSKTTLTITLSRPFPKRAVRRCYKRFKSSSRGKTRTSSSTTSTSWTAYYFRAPLDTCPRFKKTWIIR